MLNAMLSVESLFLKYSMLPEFFLPELEKDWGGLDPGFEVIIRHLRFAFFKLDFFKMKLTLFPPRFDMIG